MLLLRDLLKARVENVNPCEETRNINSAPLDPNIAKLRIKEFVNYRRRLHEEWIKDRMDYDEMNDIIAFLFDFEFISNWVQQINEYNKNEKDEEKKVDSIRIYNCVKPGPIIGSSRPDVFLIPVRKNGDDFYHVYDSPEVLRARGGNEREVVFNGDDKSLIGNSSVPCPNVCID